MIDKNTLAELKKKMPRGFLQLIVDKYKVLNDSAISRKTVDRFFNGISYSTQMHQAVLGVISDLSELQAETDAAIKPKENLTSTVN